MGLPIWNSTKFSKKGSKTYNIYPSSSSKNNEEIRVLPNSLYAANITLMTKTDRDVLQKKTINWYSRLKLIQKSVSNIWQSRHFVRETFKWTRFGICLVIWKTILLEEWYSQARNIVESVEYSPCTLSPWVQFLPSYMDLWALPEVIPESRARSSPGASWVWLKNNKKVIYLPQNCQHHSTHIQTYI